MKKLLTTIFSATAILFPLTTSENTTHKVEQSAV